MLHKNAILGEIHKVHNWEYSNESERISATGFLSTDIGKVAWQKDNDSFWFLSSYSPVIWRSFANSPNNVTGDDLEDGIRTAGVVQLPSFTDNQNGTCTIGVGLFSLYNNPDFLGIPRTYPIQQTILNLTDNSANYILADYNSGSPIYTVVTSIPAVNTTDSDRIPVYSVYRSGSDIHYFNWDHLGIGLAEKINQRLRRTDRFRIDNGLALSESSTRVVNISSGQLWAGANIITLDAISSSSITHTPHFYYHSAGNWVRGTFTQYNNSQYDDGTNLVNLTNNKYAVNWIYRSVQQDGTMYVLLGGGDYSLIEAQASKEPQKPVEIATQAILVGRIIVQKGSNTSTQIDRVIDVSFGSSPVGNHNDLSGIQGGNTSEFYHLTQSEYSGTGTGVFVRKDNPIIKYSTRLVTSDSSINQTDYTVRCNTASSAILITLPNVVSNTGRVIKIKKLSRSNYVRVQGDASIDESPYIDIFVLNQSLTLQSNGTSWDII